MAGPEQGGIEPRGVRYEQLGRVGHVVLDRPEASNAFDLPAAHSLFPSTPSRQQRYAGTSVPCCSAVPARGSAPAATCTRSFADDRPAYLRDLAATLEVEIRRLSELPLPVVVAVHGSGRGRRARLRAQRRRGRRGALDPLHDGLCGVGLTPTAVSHTSCREPSASVRWTSPWTGSQRGRGARGLVTRVAADETVTREAFALSESLAGEAAGALAGAKRLIRSSWEATRAESAADEVETIASAVTSPEAQERLSAS